MDTEVVSFWSVDRTSSELGVPVATVRGWIKKGIVPSVKIGGRRLIDALTLIDTMRRAMATGRSFESVFGEPK